MARAHVEDEPPRSAVLMRYGASFPAFVAHFPPAASVPYLADMASLEWAWHVAYHAEDAAPLPLGGLARAVEHAEDAALSLHPSDRRGALALSHRLDLRAQYPSGGSSRNAARGRRGCAGRAA